jgi:uncharacterized protein YutE (UPF0331/DUF86 family)
MKHGIISENMYSELKRYLGFRHFFVHGYGTMIIEEKLIPLAERLPSVWSKFDLEITELMKSLKRDK